MMQKIFGGVREIAARNTTLMSVPICMRVAAVVMACAIASTPVGAQTFSTNSWSGPSPSGAVGKQCLTGDFNGDGLIDIACYGGSGAWSLALSSGSNFSVQSWTSSTTVSNPISDSCMAGDFNGDGKVDIACYPGGGGSWQMLFSTGTGFNSQTWGNGSAVSTPVGTSCVAGDFSGDGMADIACYTGSSGSWALWLSSGTNFTTQSWSGGVSPTFSVNQQCIPGDFDHDGRMDIACYSGSGGNWTIAFSRGSSFTTQVWASSIAPSNPVGGQCVAGDFNGDGSTDLLCYTGSNGTWAAGISGGSVFATQFWSSSVAPTGLVNEQCATGDFNGDGLTDIACYSGSGGNWMVGLSTGRGLISQSWTSTLTPAFPITNACLTGELSGDGLADIACYSSTGGVWSIGRASPGAM